MLTPEERSARFNTQPMGLAKDQSTTWLKLPTDGIPWGDAVRKIEDADRLDGERRDFGLTKLSAYLVGPAGDGSMSLAHRDGVLPPVPLREAAFRQLCERVGAPPAYVRNLPGRLQTALLDHGLRHSEVAEGNLLRLANGEARALLSDRYAALDNGLVIETMERALTQHGLLADARVVGLATGVTTVVRLALPSDGAILPSGVENDRIQISLDVSNGEIGNRAVSVIGSLYRLICLNGLRNTYVSDVHRLRHVGEAKRLGEAFVQAVPSALAAARGTRAKLTASLDRMVDDVLGEIDGLRQFGLSVTDARDVARDVVATRKVGALPDIRTAWTPDHFGAAPVSVFEVVNGMTHVAQSRDVDARLDMEEAAGRYLDKRTR
jgi:hypothetical protein